MNKRLKKKIHLQAEECVYDLRTSVLEEGHGSWLSIVTRNMEKLFEKKPKTLLHKFHS